MVDFKLATKLAKMSAEELSKELDSEDSHTGTYNAYMHTEIKSRLRKLERLIEEYNKMLEIIKNPLLGER